MTIRKLAVTALILATTLAGWALSDRTIDAPLWQGRIDGFAYSPMQPSQSPRLRDFPSEEQLAADIDLIARVGGSVRSYSLDGSLGALPRIAAERGVPLTLGIWLDADTVSNTARLAELRRAASSPGVQRVVVGNETILTGALAVSELVQSLDAMRAALDVPVSTAEPWHIWLAHPELAQHVDYLMVHLLPYWEGVPVEAAVDLVELRMRELSSKFPNLPIVIGEVGWPSRGRDFGASKPSRENAERFLREFLMTAEQRGYEYFLMEAFDQPWKREIEGEVGAYWGLFTGDRLAKYAFAAPLTANSSWALQGAAAAVLALLAFWLLNRGTHALNAPALLLLASVSTVSASAAVWLLAGYAEQYWTLGSAFAAAVLFAGLLGMAALAFVDAHEWAEVAGQPKRRLATMRVASSNLRRPKVSIHVPAYAEPPAMLIETLDALAQLAYSNFEVIVVDNNTAQDALWTPVEAHCRRLGEQFKFFHVAPLAGYKAGALNFALSHTAEDAEIVAVIDSDYRVDPQWLDRLTPHFSAPATALVQAPQAYRDQDARAFKAMCEAEYRGFFHIGMVARNERNAIIQHGTMTMIRKRVLEEVGGWAEWTVTEDAELGLRILEHGYDSIYTTERFGRGLTPDRFCDYRAQRFRWALGAMQILRRHGSELLGRRPSALTTGQRYHYLTGWAAWLGDGLNLAFNVIALAWAALMLADPARFLPPVASVSSLVIALFAFKLLKMWCLYRRTVGASIMETVGAMLAGLSLVYIAGKAVLSGLAGVHVGFVRTPKHIDPDGLAAALYGTAAEGVLAAALIGAAGMLYLLTPMKSIDLTMWCILLGSFSVPHIAAVTMSLLGMLTRTQVRRSQPSTAGLRQAPKRS